MLGHQLRRGDQVKVNRRGQFDLCLVQYLVHTGQVGGEVLIMHLQVLEIDRGGNLLGGRLTGE
ncbi:hypothetical protein DPMN_088554 [Dreissena polymorpha]|uniref:Uncharacterized protein n=1 Tax=Dreissena polymorpha TaxID=45954 RepID=A0A9D4QXZ8_DREPO|nr:hypothetical protein DPMN_088554 [Dreissena polymorpha]